MIRMNRRTASVLRHFVKRYTQGMPVSASDAMAEHIGVGTFYPVATRMLELGWVQVVEEDPYPEDRPMRTFYQLTPRGYNKVLAELRTYNQWPSLWERIKRKVT